MNVVRYIEVFVMKRFVTCKWRFHYNLIGSVQVSPDFMPCTRACSDAFLLKTENVLFV